MRSALIRKTCHRIARWPQGKGQLNIPERKEKEGQFNLPLVLQTPHPANGVISSRDLVGSELSKSCNQNINSMKETSDFQGFAAGLCPKQVRFEGIIDKADTHSSFQLAQG